MEGVKRGNRDNNNAAPQYDYHKRMTMVKRVSQRFKQLSSAESGAE